MIRGENVICGTSTTGTGTLTLAACPHPPGGADFYATFTGMGLGTSQGTPVSYTIIEYTDPSFSTALAMEKGIGLLTLGASITASSLARTTPQMKGTSLNGTPSISYGSANVTLTGYSIVTAANTLVFIGASACDLPAFGLPWFWAGGDNKGTPPFGMLTGQSAAGALTYATEYYHPFYWTVPMLVKKVTAYVATVDTTATTNNLYGRLYAANSSFQPGKLLYDFGLMGTSNASLKTAGMVSSAVGAQGIWLLPGVYFMDFLPVNTGTAGAPALGGAGERIRVCNSGVFGSFAATGFTFSATGGVGGAAPDTANVTGYAVGGTVQVPSFTFKDVA
jgi:hypothetical protein